MKAVKKLKAEGRDLEKIEVLSGWNVSQSNQPIISISPSGIQLNTVAAEMLHCEYALVMIDTVSLLKYDS